MGSNRNEIVGLGRETWKELEPVITRGHSPERVFSDWLTMMVCAFDTQMEDTYLKVIQPYVEDRPMGERSIDCFPKAMARLMLEMRECHKDVIGGIFEQQITRGHNGQFLSPLSICDLLARLNKPEDGQWVSDPACGSGRMLLSTAKENPKARFHGKDLDFRCAQMTALNLMFFNLDGVVEHGNSLSCTIENVWLTQRSLLLGGSLRQLNEEELTQYKNKDSSKVGRGQGAVKAAVKAEVKAESEPEQIHRSENEDSSSDKAEQGNPVIEVAEEFSDLPLFQHLRDQ